MTEQKSAAQIIAAVAALAAGAAVVEKSRRRLEVKLPAEGLYAFAAALRTRLGFEHLSAISCVDWIADHQFELVYHFWTYRDNCLLSAKVRIDRETAAMGTLTDLWQPASFFERDIHEMFGVDFLGNKDQERFILTDWKGPPPMRKDFVTRDFAHEHFTYKDYEPSWDDLVTGGYHGGTHG